jgi:hypothetical protein
MRPSAFFAKESGGRVSVQGRRGEAVVEVSCHGEDDDVHR